MHAHDDMQVDRDIARAQVETLAAALKWYAEDNSYKERAFKEDGVFKSMTPALKDAGDRARAALKAAGVET